MIVVGLGVDLVEIDRVAAVLGRWGGRLVARLMDPDEAARLPEGPARVLALAVAIAGKEAASKAIGTGWSRGVTWRDVVVKPGPPASLAFRRRAAEVARALGSSGEARVSFEVHGNLVVGEVRLLGG